MQDTQGRIWRSRRALAQGAARALWHFGRMEAAEGTLGRTLQLTRSRRALAFARDWTFAELLEWAARTYQSRSFIEYGAERISFNEMNRRANRVAHNLQRLGVAAGDGVAIMMGNHPRFLEVFFATQKLGAYCVPINAGLLGDGLRYILDHSEVKAVVLDHEAAPKVAAVRNGLMRISLCVVSSDEADAGFVRPSEMVDYTELTLGPVGTGENLGLTADPTTPSLLLYTSGTTGLPKAVVTPYCAQRTKAIGLLANAQYGSNDRLYTCLPLFHANALMLSVMPALWAGIPLYVSKRFSASRFFRELSECGATAFNTVGGMIPILLKTPPSPYDRSHKVKRVLSAACPKDAWEPFEKRFGVDLWEAYGAVDGGGLAIANLGNCPVGSIGKMPAKGRLVNEQGNDVQVGEPGELIVKVGHGAESKVLYFKNEKASNEKVKDGYLYTGDIMQRDAQGFLYFVGRNTDSMRRRGENVSAYEVEKQVDAHPDVLESAAFGVPSEMGEDDIMIAVVPVDGHRVDPQELVRFLSERLPKYAQPAYLDVVAELPKTGTHRVIKTDLKKRGVTAHTIRLEALRKN